MRTLLLSILIILPITSFSQHPGISIAYIYDHHSGNAWQSERGVKLGLGVENMVKDELPLSLAVRYSASFTKSKFDTTLQSIEFELSDDHDYTLGYGDVDFKKLNFGLDFDLGYQDGEYAVIEPYATFGLQLENYNSTIEYELYQEDTCHCYYSTPEPISQTTSLGYQTGLGFKIRPTEFFYFDFRATYYGGWTIMVKESDIMPSTSSLHMNSHGVPTYTSSNQRYNDGFRFSAGIIFRIGGNGDSDYSSSYDSDDDDDDDYDSNSSGGSGSSGSSCTPTKLTPASGRGGGSE